MPFWSVPGGPLRLGSWFPVYEVGGGRVVSPMRRNTLLGAMLATFVLLAIGVLASLATPGDLGTSLPPPPTTTL